MRVSDRGWAVTHCRLPFWLVQLRFLVGCTGANVLRQPGGASMSERLGPRLVEPRGVHHSADRTNAPRRTPRVPSARAPAKLSTRTKPSSRSIGKVGPEGRPPANVVSNHELAQADSSTHSTSSKHA